MSTECADSIGVLGDDYWECIVQLRDRLSNDPCPQKCNEVFALVNGSVCTAQEVAYLPNAIGVFLAEPGVHLAQDVCERECREAAPELASLTLQCQSDLFNAANASASGFAIIRSGSCSQLIATIYRTKCVIFDHVRGQLPLLNKRRECLHSVIGVLDQFAVCGADLEAFRANGMQPTHCPKACLDTFHMAANVTCDADMLPLIPSGIGAIMEVVQAAAAGDICYGDCLSYHLPLASSLAADCEVELISSFPTTFESLNSSPCVDVQRRPQHLGECASEESLH